MYLYAALQYSSMSSSDSDSDAGHPEKIPCNGECEDMSLWFTYNRLYKETTIYLSTENRFSVYMGIKPELKKAFTREMRIRDHFHDTSITVTLYQFVRMLSNFKCLVWPRERYEAYCNSDERYSFTIPETLAPKVETMSIAVDGRQTRYKFNILGRPDKSILFDKTSLETLLDSEMGIINVFRSLNPEAVEEEYRKFNRECRDIPNIKAMPKEEVRTLVAAKAHEASTYEMNAFALETVLKFWDFFYFNLFI